VEAKYITLGLEASTHQTVPRSKSGPVVDSWRRFSADC